MEVQIDVLVKDAFIGVLTRFVELLGESDEALCSAIAMLTATFEAELKRRLPLDNPQLICNTRAYIEGMADRMNRELLKKLTGREVFGVLPGGPPPDMKG